jgi:hypothetical protein
MKKGERRGRKDEHDDIPANANGEGSVGPDPAFNDWHLTVEVAAWPV